MLPAEGRHRCKPIRGSTAHPALSGGVEALRKGGFQILLMILMRETIGTGPFQPCSYRGELIGADQREYILSETRLNRIVAVTGKFCKKDGKPDPTPGLMV